MVLSRPAATGFSTSCFILELSPLLAGFAATGSLFVLALSLPPASPPLSTSPPLTNLAPGYSLPFHPDLGLTLLQTSACLSDLCHLSQHSFLSCLVEFVH